MNLKALTELRQGFFLQTLSLKHDNHRFLVTIKTSFKYDVIKDDREKYQSPCDVCRGCLCR